MDKEEILDYNKLCAEFLNIEKFKDLLSTLNSGKISIETNIYEQSKFHSDWNWIMQVVEKILEIYSESDYMEIYYNIIDKIPDKEAVVEIIYELLKYYNNENK